MNRLKIPEKRDLDVKLVRLEDACARYSYGRSTMRKIAEDAGAVVRIGRCYRINLDRTDAYLDAVTE